MIDGVMVVPLKLIPDSRGMILHYMRKDNPIFADFNIQEVYFSLIYPGAIKGWHCHRRMTLNYIVPMGNIKLVLYDDRETSPTAFEMEEIYLGPTNYQLVRIPPLIWNGFVAVGSQPALVGNITDCIHDPNEIMRISPKDFHLHGPVYDWFGSNQG